MSTQSITLDLPEEVMRRAQQAAQALQRPLEEVLTAVLTAALPDLNDAPADMRDELAAMTWLGDQVLQDLSRSTMPKDHQDQLRKLTEAAGQRPLSEKEEWALDALRHEYGQVTLRKARAYALLSLRSGRAMFGIN